jgi:UDP-N-acetyl-D-mannosaminuronate dehydrogenase
MWIQADQFFEKILPLKNNSKKNYLKKNKNFELEDSLEVYLIAVNETIKRNEIAPLSYVRPTLKQILINKRKLELMQQFDQAVFEEAAQKNIFEVYE